MTRALSSLLLLASLGPVWGQAPQPGPSAIAGAYRADGGPRAFTLVRAAEGDEYGGLLALDDTGESLQRLVLRRDDAGWTLEVRERVPVERASGAIDALATRPAPQESTTWTWSQPQLLSLREDGPGLLHPRYALQHPEAPHPASPLQLIAQPLGEPAPSGRPFVVYGHRGLPTKHPENTLPSIEAALDAGANGVEIDLCLTADGQVVLWHDSSTGGLISLVRNLGFEGGMAYMPNYPPLGSDFRRPVHELTLAELRAHYGYSPRRFTLGDLEPEPGILIPTLDEAGPLLARCDRMILDIKVPEVALIPRFAASLDAVLRKHDLVERAIVMHPDEELVAALKAALPSHYALTHDVEITRVWGGGDPADYSAVARARARDLRVCSVGRPRVMLWGGWKLYSGVLRHDRAQIDAAGDGMLQIAWTLNDEAELREAIAIGVDGVVTDDPALVSDLARRLGR